jgi:hypothetical protein
MTRLLISAVFCAAMAVGQTVAHGVVGVKVILGPKGSAMTLSQTPAGGIAGSVEKLPKGKKGYVSQAGGNAMTRTPVNDDGTFFLPQPSVPRPANFTLCLEVEGEAPICSAPGALSSFANARPAVGQPTAPPRGPIAAAQFDPGIPMTPADAAVLKNVQINKRQDGSWQCVGQAGVCSSSEVQALSRTVTTTVKSASNIKSLLVVAPNGTIGCKDSATGTPCTTAEANDFASALKTRHDTVKHSINNVR